MAKGIDVDHHGSEARISMTLPDGTKIVHILQHMCCDSPNAIVWAKHLSVIKRKFAITDDDFDAV
jgi:hypothetical protein